MNHILHGDLEACKEIRLHEFKGNGYICSGGKAAENISAFPTGGGLFYTESENLYPGGQILSPLWETHFQRDMV